MISEEQGAAVCEAYISALSNGDAAAIAALYADDATLEDPVGTEVKQGIDAIRAFYDFAASSVISARLSGAPRVAGNEAAFAFEIVAGAGENTMTIDVIDVFRFDDNGKVASMRAFWGSANTR